MPRLGVVTAAYNAARWLPAALQSVRSQSFQDWAHIVVDDGSTDDSVHVLERETGSDSRQRYISTQNQGMVSARKAGRSLLPDVEFLCFADADDELMPLFFERLIALLDTRPDAAVACSSWHRIDEEGRRLSAPPPPRYAPGRWRPIELGKESLETPFASIYCWAPLIEPAAVMRSTWYDMLGGWTDSLPAHGQSIRLFGSAALLGGHVLYSDTGDYGYRIHSGQFSAHAEGRDNAAVMNWWASQLPSLSPPLRETVVAAEHFRMVQLRRHLALKSSRQLLSEGRPILSARMAAGGLLRSTGTALRATPLVRHVGLGRRRSGTPVGTLPT